MQYETSRKKVHFSSVYFTSLKFYQITNRRHDEVKILQFGVNRVKGEGIKASIYAVQDFDQFTSSKQEAVKKLLDLETWKKIRNF